MTSLSSVNNNKICLVVDDLEMKAMSACLSMKQALGAEWKVVWIQNGLEGKEAVEQALLKKEHAIKSLGNSGFEKVEYTDQKISLVILDFFLPEKLKDGTDVTGGVIAASRRTLEKGQKGHLPIYLNSDHQPLEYRDYFDGIAYPLKGKAASEMFPQELEVLAKKLQDQGLEIF